MYNGFEIKKGYRFKILKAFPLMTTKQVDKIRTINFISGPRTFKFSDRYESFYMTENQFLQLVKEGWFKIIEETEVKGWRIQGYRVIFQSNHLCIGCNHIPYDHLFILDAMIMARKMKVPFKIDEEAVKNTYKFSSNSSIRKVTNTKITILKSFPGYEEGDVHDLVDHYLKPKKGNSTKFRTNYNKFQIRDLEKEGWISTHKEKAKITLCYNGYPIILENGYAKMGYGKRIKFEHINGLAEAAREKIKRDKISNEQS